MSRTKLQSFQAICTYLDKNAIISRYLHLFQLIFTYFKLQFLQAFCAFSSKTTIISSNLRTHFKDKLQLLQAICALSSKTTIISSDTATISSNLLLGTSFKPIHIFWLLFREELQLFQVICTNFEGKNASISSSSLRNCHLLNLCDQIAIIIYISGYFSCKEKKNCNYFKLSAPIYIQETLQVFQVQPCGIAIIWTNVTKLQLF